MGKTCLVVKNDGIGDLVLCSGVLKELSKQFTGGLDLVTIGDNRELMGMLPWVRKVYYTPLHGYGIKSYLKGGVTRERIPEGGAAALSQLASTEYDTAISLRRYIRAANLIAMRRVRAGERHCMWQILSDVEEQVARKYSRGWQHFRTVDTSPVHELDYYRRFLSERLGVDADCAPTLHLPPCGRGRETGRIGLILGGRVSKWPLQSWLELARRLSAEGFQVCLFGGPDQEKLAGYLTTAAACESYVGRLGFADSVEPLSRCEAVIGNDTGFTHFASLVVPKIIIIYGGGTFRRFFPWPGADNHFVLFRGMDCFDCLWNCRFSHKFCLESIAAEDVFSYFKEVMAGGEVPRLKNLSGDRNVLYDLVRTFDGVSRPESVCGS